MKVMRIVLPALLAAVLAGGAVAAEETPAPQEWSFSGIFGSYDKAAVRRGFEVYNQICSACHSLNLLAYRNLTEIGFTEDQVKSIAAEHQVTAGPNDKGEMYQRPAHPADHFVPPFANEELARLANNGALPPDLSVIVKARKGGPDYIYDVLTGFVEPPDGFKVPSGMFYNKAFPGHDIAMPPPLADGAVTYSDKTLATVPQEAHDVVTFLNWAAEPELDARKKLGLRTMLFLILLTAMLYAVKRKIWSKVH